MSNKLRLICLYLWIATFLFTACTPSVKENKHIEEINLLNAYENKGEVPLSYVADSVEYIRLESSSRCLFDEPYLIGVNDSIILITSFKRILIFSRSDGTFRYEISSYGRGPNEYMNNIGNSYNEKTSTIYTTGSPGSLITGFSLDGTANIRFKKPEPIFGTQNEFSITSFWPLSDNRFLGYSKNHSGTNPEKLVLFDSLGKIVSSFRNYNFFDRNKYKAESLDPKQGWFFTIKDTVRFFELYTDTIFTVTENRISPKFYLKMDKLALPYYLQGVEKEYSNERLNYFYIKDLRESSRFLIFTVGINKFRHFCLYDKKLMKTLVCELIKDKEYYKYSIDYETRIIGLVNDIDNFIPFGTGKGGLFINHKDEMSTYILASDVERWFKMNPEKAARLPANLQNFSNVKPTDNIIIEAVKLKKY